MKKAVIDMHCDLTSYLTRPETSIYDSDEIGCALPQLEDGNVKLQIMAFFAPTEADSHLFGIKQSEIFADLNNEKNVFFAFKTEDIQNLSTSNGVGMLASIESGSAFCDEKITLKEGFDNLETIISNVGNICYISLTHHDENRFGGGNYSTAGLKEDGIALIEYISGRNIAIDFSHTSDALASGILDYLSKNNMSIPILASHSNYRTIFDHPRNLPDDIASEIIKKEGIIGMNFLRAFMNLENPEALQEHIAHGIHLGGKDCICYGADFFYTKSNKDVSRLPFYFKEHEDAGCYPSINNIISAQFGEDISNKLSSGNAINFLQKLWN